MQRKSRKSRRARLARRALVGFAPIFVAVVLGAGGIGCKGDPLPPDLTVQNANRLPTRLAQGPNWRFYVSDARIGSVFIYGPDLRLVGELKQLDRPLGVVVDALGQIYVGNDGRDNVEVYSPAGVKLREIGAGTIRMPNDLDLDEDGNLYVVDSLSDTVRVFDAAGAWLRDIGSAGDAAGELSFPAAVAIAYRSGFGEVYVADQGHARIQVYDLQGAFLRGYGSEVGAFSGDWQGKFVKLQSLAIDEFGRLHAADSYLNRIQILDPDTGAYLDSYGSFGTGAGELNVPLDIAIAFWGSTVVANSGNRKVENLFAPSQP